MAKSKAQLDRELIQRWIGADQCGDLNQASTHIELMKEDALGITSNYASAYTPGTKTASKFIQRWVGAPQSGDLNDEVSVAELLKDIHGLEAYLIAKKAEGPRVPVVPQTDQTPTGFKVFEHSTPNQGGRITPNYIVLHHSDGSFQGSLSWIQEARSRVSYHTIIHPDGSRHNVVDFNKRAWHAGKSQWAGRSGCNGFTVGIAFSGNTYTRLLTNEERASCIELCNYLKGRYPIKEVIDHRMVSPGRKDDLNIKTFNQILAEF